MKQVLDTDLRLLRVFLAVVDAGGYAGAQSELNISNSTISLHMSDLEGRLGFRLCERGRGGFQLTERGRVVYDETRRLLSTLDDFAGSLATLRRTLGGRLLLGMVDCLTTHPDFPLARALRSFNTLDHDVYVELTVAPRIDLERSILNRQLHAAIVPKLGRTRGFESRPILREEHHLYCGRGHPLYATKGMAVSRQEIASHAFVLRSYNEAFDTARFPERSTRAIVHSMEGMAVLLLSGGYVGYLPEHYAQPNVDRGELVRVDAPGFSYTSSHVLITAQGRRHPPALVAFLPFVETARRAARKAASYGALEGRAEDALGD